MSMLTASFFIQVAKLRITQFTMTDFWRNYGVLCFMIGILTPKPPRHLCNVSFKRVHLHARGTRLEEYHCDSNVAGLRERL